MQKERKPFKQDKITSVAIKQNQGRLLPPQRLQIIF